jgi:hypothetical protein
MAAVVVLHDILGESFGSRWDGTAAPEEGTVENFPGLEGPVVLDESPVQEGEEEDGVEGYDAEGDAEHAAGDLAWMEREVSVECWKGGRGAILTSAPFI